MPCIVLYESPKHMPDVTEAQAKSAAEGVSSTEATFAMIETKFARLERSIDLLKWMTGVHTVLFVTILGRMHFT